MAEKLNRYRSTRNQTRTPSGNSSEDQNSSPRLYVSLREENQYMIEPSVRRVVRQNKKISSNYPPLEDYAE